MVLKTIHQTRFGQTKMNAERQKKSVMKKKEEEAPAEPPAPPRQEILLEEIRNLLAKQS